MKLRVLIPYRTSRASEIDLFAESIRREGDEVVRWHPGTGPDPEPGDLLVTWNNRSKEERHLATDWLCMEQGFLGDRVKEYFYLGFNGLNGAGSWRVRCGVGYGWQPKVQQSTTGKMERVLVLGQCAGDENLKELGVSSYQKWLDAMIDLCRKRGCVPRYRSHPRWTGFPLCKMDHEEYRRLRLPIERDMDWCDTVLAWSSNAVVDAILIGKRAVIGSNLSVARRWSEPVGNCKKEPNTYGERFLWLDYVASGQFHISEIADGRAWRIRKEEMFSCE